MGKTSIVKFRREPKEKHPHVHGEDLGIYWALRILWTFLMVE